MAESEPDQVEMTARSSAVGRSVIEAARRYGRITGIGLAIVNLAFGAYYYYNTADSGEHELLPPVGRLADPPSADSHKITVFEWNIESESERHNDYLRWVDRHFKPTFVLVQEVTGSAAKGLMNDFKGYYGLYGVASSSLESIQFGNMILSRYAPSDVHSQSIDGTSLLDSLVGMNIGAAKDAAIDVANSVSQLRLDGSINNTKNALQESRDLISATFSPIVNDQIIGAWVATTHISGDPAVQSRQFRTVVKLLKEKPKKASLEIACADLNYSQESVVERALATDGLKTPPKTGFLADRNGDYCSVSGPGTATYRTLITPDTAEHAPTMLTITIPPAKASNSGLIGRP